MHPTDSAGFWQRCEDAAVKLWMLTCLPLCMSSGLLLKAVQLLLNVEQT